MAIYGLNKKPIRWGSIDAVRQNVRHVSQEVFGHRQPITCFPFWSGTGLYGRNYGLSPTPLALQTGGVVVWSDGGIERISSSGNIGNQLEPKLSGIANVSILIRLKMVSIATRQAYVWKQLASSTDQKFLFQINSGADFTINSGGAKTTKLSAAAGVWAQYACISDGTNIYLYNDSGNSSQTTGGALTAATNDHLSVGGRENGDYPVVAGTVIDYIRIYDTALSESDVYAHFDRPYAEITRRSIPIYFDLGAGAPAQSKVPLIMLQQNHYDGGGMSL